MYHLDQSIKIENANKTTYVCLTNSKTSIISISAKEKHLLKSYFRTLGKPLIFKLFTFSVLCSHAIHLTKADNIIIDLEYLGHERLIKTFILQILHIYRQRSFPEIHFSAIGKHSSAHLKAYFAMKHKSKSITINSDEIIRLYEKINKK